MVITVYRRHSSLLAGEAKNTRDMIYYDNTKMLYSPNGLSQHAISSCHTIKVC